MQCEESLSKICILLLIPPFMVSPYFFYFWPVCFHAHSSALPLLAPCPLSQGRPRSVLTSCSLLLTLIRPMMVYLSGQNCLGLCCWWHSSEIIQCPAGGCFCALRILFSAVTTVTSAAHLLRKNLAGLGRCKHMLSVGYSFPVCRGYARDSIQV